MDWSDLERRCHSVSPGIVAKARRGMWASAVMDLDEAGDALRPFVFLRAALEMDSDSWTEVRLLRRAACSAPRHGRASAGHGVETLVLTRSAPAAAAAPLHLQRGGPQDGAGPAERRLPRAWAVPAGVDREPRRCEPVPPAPPAPPRVRVA